MCLEYLKKRRFDVCQNTSYSARNCQSESLDLTSLALPPGKRNTKRNLKTTSNVEKNLQASVDNLQWLKEKRHNLIWKKDFMCQEENKFGWYRDNNTLLLWLPKFGEITQGRQAAGDRARATHLHGGSLCQGGPWRDCSPWRTHNRMRTSGWHGSAEKNLLCTSPTSCATCHLTQRDKERMSATCREVGTRKGRGEVLDWRSVWGKGEKDISLGVCFIHPPLIFLLNSQSNY